MKKQCTAPIEGYIGKYGFTYRKNDYPIKLRCGKCSACLAFRSSGFVARCIGEERYWHFTYFITLTYENNPFVLEKKPLQLFLKRLRHVFKKPIKYVACGEYGDKNRRPHYHLVIFTNEPLPDPPPYFGYSPRIGYSSDTIRLLWPYGFNLTKTATSEGYSYIFKYMDKCHHGYGFISEYGEIIENSGFLLSSRRPAIGRRFYDDFKEEFMTQPCLHLNGFRYPIPSYYRRLWAEEGNPPPPVYNLTEETKEQMHARQYATDPKHPTIRPRKTSRWEPFKGLYHLQQDD